MRDLSARGRSYAVPPPRSLAVTDAARDDAYHLQTNPQGYINLSVSENTLSLRRLHDRVCKVPPPPPETLLYGPSHGSPDFLSAVADLYARRFLPSGQIAHPQNFVATCGAGAALDILVGVLCDPGDRVLVPAPGYGGFARDVCLRPATELVVAPMDACATRPTTLLDGRVNVAAFEKAWMEAGGCESGIRLMVICSPVNPTGELLSPQLIRDLVTWARGRDLHTIFDEAYAQSVYGDGARPSTVATALDGNLGDDVHTVWTFSKDFCWSGARVGVAYSQNEDVLRALRPSIAYLTGASRYTMWALTDMLKDVEWVESFLRENNRMLCSAYKNARRVFEEHGIEFFRAEAGLFMWIDLRRWMTDDTKEEEMALVARCAKQKVPIRPSSECFGTTYGFFRVSFAAVDESTFTTGFKRLTTTVLSHACIKRTIFEEEK